MVWATFFWAGFHRLGTGHTMIKKYWEGTNLKFKQGLQVRKVASWLHYKPRNGTYLEPPTSRQCCDHCADSCEDAWWFEAAPYVWAGFHRSGSEISVCKWQCSIKIWQFDRLSLLKTTHRVSSPNDDLPFGHMKPALLIKVLVLPVAMLDVFDRDVEALVSVFCLFPVLDDRLNDMGKCWFHIFSLLFENAPVHWKIILDSVIGWSLLLTSLPMSPMYFNSTNILSSNLHSNGTLLFENAPACGLENYTWLCHWLVLTTYLFTYRYVTYVTYVLQFYQYSQ